MNSFCQTSTGVFQLSVYNPNKGRVPNKSLNKHQLTVILWASFWNYVEPSYVFFFFFFLDTKHSRIAVASFCIPFFFSRFPEFPGQHEPRQQLHRGRDIQIRRSCFLSEDLWLHVLSVIGQPPPTRRQVHRHFHTHTHRVCFQRAVLNDHMNAG